MNTTGVYSGAAEFGKVWTIFSAVAASFLAVAMILGGIYIIYHRAHLVSVKGKVTKSSYNCVTHTNNNVTTKSCQVNVAYSIDGKTYNKTFSSSTMYKVDDDVFVYYDPSDPTEAEIDPVAKWIGWALIGGAIFIALSSWIWVWLVERYKFLAAAQGVKGVYDILR